MRGCARARSIGWLLGWIGLCSSFLFVCLSYPAHGAEADPFTKARTGFFQTQAQYQHHPQNLESAWQFARACFDLAEFATNKTERARLAEQGIEACRNVLKENPDSPQVHYYLGMNLGQLARTRTLGALKLVDQMEREFTSARDLDPKFDYAGPDRNLGQLYLDAPTIGSIGSRAKARQHLQRAVEVAPDYPDNRLCLLEAFMKWGDREHARQELKQLEKIWPGARTSFKGQAWATSWEDWEIRLQKAKKRIEEPSKVIEAPRH